MSTSFVEQPQFDEERVRNAIRELLIGIGENPDREGLQETPARIARSYQEIFSGLGTDPSEVLSTTFAENFHEMIIVRDIPFTSMCEHHLLPFWGHAHVAYIPGKDGKVTGLSKLARLVEGYSRRPQIQERLTTQIAEALIGALEASGALVVIEAEHMCMNMRGVRKPGSYTVTSAVRGALRNATTRAEAMSLIQGGRS